MPKDAVVHIKDSAMLHSYYTASGSSKECAAYGQQLKFTLIFLLLSYLLLQYHIILTSSGKYPCRGKGLELHDL